MGGITSLFSGSLGGITNAGAAAASGGSGWMSGLVNAGKTAASSPGFWSGVGNFASGLFGGSGSSGGSSALGSIAQGIIGGLGASAATSEAMAMNERAEAVRGAENRKTKSFEADLLDYYKKKDNREKRLALDTYGQFSTLRNWKPDYKETPLPVVPTRPTP